MKNKLLILLCLIISLSSVSCIYGTNNFLYKGNKVDYRIDEFHRLNDFESTIDVQNLPNKYQILVITDTHFGSPKKTTETESFYKWLDTLNDENRPKFCLILGDNVDRGYENEYKLFCKFVKHIEDKGIPGISTVGNHDLYNSGWDLYVKYCYPNCSLFHFETKAFSWYSIDTGTGIIGTKQFKILKRALRSEDKPKIILSHYPLTNSKWVGAISLHDSTERNLLIDLYSRTNVKTLLCGHLHQINYADLGPFIEYGHPSFCYADFNAWTLYEIDESDNNNPKITQLPRDF